MNKIYKLIFINIFLLGYIFMSIAFAEGSKDLVENSPDNSYRPYLEWHNDNTLGIPRRNAIDVYAIAGETIKFGSSIYNSFDSRDIIVQYPDGTTQTFDVLLTGLGYIDTVAKEQIGPFPGLGGYIPLEINVTQTGIYVFYFHGETFLSGTNANPTAITVTSNFLVNQASNIAAWDISVEFNGNIIEGRVFATYLPLNIGSNIVSEDFLQTTIYVLTEDGYLYKVNLDNVDPFGFLVYANNRGLVDAFTNSALYRSAVATDNSFRELKGNILVPQPQNGNTSMDIFYNIFFNIPANDLPSEIPTIAIPPPEAADFRFNGIAGNRTEEAVGGYFSFRTNGIANYQIEINLGTEILTIGNTSEIGENRLFWDGRDSLGNIVPIGTYDATLKLTGGEYHFPFFDVENSYGLQIELLNPPYIYPGFNPFLVYYDNSNYEIGGVFIDLSGTGITNPVDASINGIDSSIGGGVVYTNNYGNEKVIDIWTYFGPEDITTQIIVEETVNDFTIVIISLIIVLVGTITIIYCYSCKK